MDSHPDASDFHPATPTATPLPDAATPDTPRRAGRADRYWLHLLLFALTLLTTCMAGTVLVTNRHWFSWEAGSSGPLLTWVDLPAGLPYALSFLGFLTVHEFGHYFMAVLRGIRTSLPYYIPIYLPFAMLNIGSFGAVIRLRALPRTSRDYFDIGIAGPLAGFVVALGLLIYGFTHLPPLEYLYQMNPNYLDDFGGIPSERDILERYGGGLAVGSSLLFAFFREFVADPALMPNRFEIIHYPYLFVGFITLFFTALNLLPIGQLDGGHVTYGLFGRRRAGWISRGFVLLLVAYGGLGLVDFGASDAYFSLGIYLLYLLYVTGRILAPATSLLPRILLMLGILGLQQLVQGYWAAAEFNFLWLFYAFLAVRVIRLDHPPAPVELPLDGRRRALGWLALVIFVLSFTPEPLQLVSPQQARPHRKADAPGIFTAAPLPPPPPGPSTAPQP